MQSASDRALPVRPQLGLWDAVSIIVGIVVGTSIFKSPPLIFNNASSPTAGLLAWGLGGLLSFVGALCYAELASTYPRSGGDYVYLTRAFGSLVGFLFGWAQLAVLLTSGIGTMAFVFGDYAVGLASPPGTVAPAELLERYEALEKTKGQMGPPPEDAIPIRQEVRGYRERREWWAAGLGAAAVLALTLTNVLGVVLGKWTQNVLSALKLLGLAAIVVCGLAFGSASLTAADAPPTNPSFGLAMVLILYAYGGWNDAAFVAAEMRDRRQIVRSLLIGIAIITVAYLAVNAAYLRALGFGGIRTSNTVAADTLAQVAGGEAATVVSLLVMVSALGAINGLTFTGSRVYSTLGADHRVFALLGRWNPRLGSPVWSLVVQGVVAVVMIGLVGTAAGRGAIDATMHYLFLPTVPWDKYFGGFETLLAATAPVFWAFFFLSGVSLFVLRWKDAHLERPFRVPLFPVLPLVFCLMCLYMLYSAVLYAEMLTLLGAVPLLVGLPLYFLGGGRRAADIPSATPNGGPSHVA